MTDAELLQAIQAMIDPLENKMMQMEMNLTEIKSEMEKNLTEIKSEMEKNLTEVKSEIIDIKESLEEVRSATNYLSGWVEGLEDAFHKHEITTAR